MSGLRCRRCLPVDREPDQRQPPKPEISLRDIEKAPKPLRYAGPSGGADLEKPQRDAAGNPGSITMAIIRLMITEIYIYKRKDYYQ